ncbi:hypothetical protein TWF506_005431 [Arthrobotrys conoides]|uniref:Uncharacterized protein n=1 Tax=Arthrobotrys conoides TaxID=74498 RepID=A0AAN8NJL8_9PEZI
MATITPSPQQDAASSTPPPGAADTSSAAATGLQSTGGSNVIVTVIVIPISGTRPAQLGAFLKSPTNMSIKGSLSLCDDEYEQIRDSIDEAIRSEALLRDLDVDAKNSTEEERKQFHGLISEYLSADISKNDQLVDKLTVRYKDVSPWLLYKFALLRRKKYKNMVKVNGLKDDSNDEHCTIDIGNPDFKEEDVPIACTTSRTEHAQNYDDPSIQDDPPILRGPVGARLKRAYILNRVRQSSQRSSNGSNNSLNAIQQAPVQEQGGNSVTEKPATGTQVNPGYADGVEPVEQDRLASSDRSPRMIIGLKWCEGNEQIFVDRMEELLYTDPSITFSSMELVIARQYTFKKA